MKPPKISAGPKLPKGAQKIANIGVFKVPKVASVKSVKPIKMGSARKR